ncbi:hypothetical protein KP509_38G038800 [Ceratopteris richardii]|uniref:Ubiquitin-like domain-containing protein n=1 Tax=Ceratopteris richardii TaxID=49495 RepID=A0A8T2Q460_CERRI|nr:hypothetical protein KP509_38G038800 [Ceratopteris richardii]
MDFGSVTNNASQNPPAQQGEDEKKPLDQHLSLKVKGQVSPQFLRKRIQAFSLSTNQNHSLQILNSKGFLTFEEDGNEVFFRIKRSTQLRKLMNAYCERQSVDPNSIAFLFDGRRLRAEQTPAELEMEEGDEIDAMLHQTGGFLP